MNCKVKLKQLTIAEKLKIIKNLEDPNSKITKRSLGRQFNVD